MYDPVSSKIHCKICNSTDVVPYNISSLPLSAQPFTTLPSDNLFTSSSLYLCDSCGHMFLDMEPVPYYKSVIRSVSVSTEMTAFRKRQFANLCSLFSKPVSSLRVLEIGAGDGQYSSLLSEFFPQCYATEKDASNNSSSSFHFIDTHPDDDDFIHVMDSYAPFDLVCCFSYFEHLPDPVHVFHQISQLLNPSGYALLEVPNSNYIRENGLLSEVIPDHLHYFSVNSMLALSLHSPLNIVSFESIWSDYILSFLFHKPESVVSTIDRFTLSHNSVIQQIEEQLSALLPSEKVAVWGAGHQSLFILAASSLAKRVDYVIDSSPFKQTKYIPSISTPISPPSVLFSDSISLLFVICAGYNHEVISTIGKMQLPAPPLVFSVLDNKLTQESI